MSWPSTPAPDADGTSASRRVLVLSDIPVNPQESFSQVCVWQRLRQLLRGGHRVSYAALLSPPGAAHAREVIALAQHEGLDLPATVPLAALRAGAYDVLYLTHLWRTPTLTLGARLAASLRALDRRPAVVYDSHDCLFKGVAPFMSPADAATLIAAERDLRALADCSVLISETERQDAIARFGLTAARTHVLSPVAELQTSALAIPHSERRDLCFVGFPHASNLEALRYFLSDVFPRLLQRRPSLRLHLMGSGLQRLRLQLPEAVTQQVDVHGYVPALAQAVGQCRLQVAPIRQGAGIKGKVLESMACGTPVVGTAKAFEGMPVQDGVQALHAETPEQFCDQILRAYDGEALWTSLQRAGAELVQSRYAVSVLASELDALMRAVGRHRS